MKNWLTEHGSPALQRAYADGYDVRRGIAEQVEQALAESLDMDIHRQWREVGERSSPRSEAFLRRDLVQELLKSVPLPEGWHAEAGRISRVSLKRPVGGVEHFTGVIVSVRDAERKLILQFAVDFESAYSE